MKIEFAFLLLLLFSQVAFSCSPEEQRTDRSGDSSIFAICPKLEAQLKEYGDSYVQKDFSRLLDLTYRKYINMSGGRERLLAEATQGDNEFQAHQIQVVSWNSADATQLLEESGVLYAVIPTTMKLKWREQTQESYVCLIGVSTDSGEHWTFVSSTCVRLSQAFPEVAEKLILCPKITEVVRWPGSN